jgi:predicted DNA binding CopG/RHH family protein
VNEFDQEEQELLASFEAKEWQSVKTPERMTKLQSYAKASIAKGLCVYHQIDLEGIQARAIEEDIPYKRL